MTAGAGPTPQHELSEDERILHKLGYAQELFRAMGGFQNFAISFTIISILAGCLTSYYIAFESGGPIAVTWAWLINVLDVRITALLTTVSAYWHMAGVVVIVAVLVIVPNHHQSLSYVFTGTANATGYGGNQTGFHHAAFWLVFGLGLLMAQYTITGFDASAHMAEETQQASRTAAIGMYMSVVVSVIFGFILLVAVTFAVPSTKGALGNIGAVVPWIWSTSMSQGWSDALLFICVVAQFFCVTASTTSASRMMFAFSRDRAVPGHSMWRRVSTR